MEVENKELKKGVAEVAGRVYDDIGHPVLKPIGELLGMFPRTLRVFANGWDKWLTNREESVLITAKAIENKLSNIPEEKICNPEAYVAIPAVQQICYCQNSFELQELYANLLVSSMNKDTKQSVHPAFVDIIKQLTPDEARILNSVGNYKNNFQPLLDVKAFNKGENKGGHQLLITNFTTIGFDVIEVKENICNYIDNLVRLKLFEIPPTYHLTDSSLYDPLINSPVLKRMLAPYRQVFDFDYNHKIIVISNFGLAFKRVCCSN